MALFRYGCRLGIAVPFDRTAKGFRYKAQRGKRPAIYDDARLVNWHDSAVYRRRSIANGQDDYRTIFCSGDGLRGAVVFDSCAHFFEYAAERYKRPAVDNLRRHVENECFSVEDYFDSVNSGRQHRGNRV